MNLFLKIMGNTLLKTTFIEEQYAFILIRDIFKSLCSNFDKKNPEY